MRSGAFDAGDIEAAPSVIGPQHVGDEDDPLADGDVQHEQQDGAVYVPAQPMAEDAEQAELLVFTDAQGQRVLLVFSALERLVASCGDEQPWVAVPSEQLDALADHLEADGIGLDLNLGDLEGDDE